MASPGIQRRIRVRAQLPAICAWLSQRFGTIMGSSLARNAYALMASIVVTSALGMLFWLLAGRLFEQAVVGIASVLINTAMTISVATRLSLNNVLQRFLPGTGAGAGRLVGGALAVGGTLGCIAAFGFALLAGTFMPDLAFLAESWELPVFFSVVVAVWAVYSLLESTFSALRAAHWVAVFSISSSVLKIGALLAASIFAADALGLLAAWIVPILPAVVLGSYLVFQILLPRLSKTGNPLASIGTMARFCGFDYFAGLAPTIAIAAAPLIVLNYSGPETTAQFYIGWLIAYSIYLMGHSMGISLLAESVVTGERIASLAGQAIMQAALPITAISIAIAILAPFLMSLFGPQYQDEGTAILRLLALSCIPWVLETIFLAVARAKDWLHAIFGVQWLNLILVLSFGLFLVPRMGGAGMALAWLFAQSLSVLVILIGAMLIFGTGRALNTAIVLASGPSRILQAKVRTSESAPGAPDRGNSALASLHANARLSQLAHLFPDVADPEHRDKGSVSGAYLIETAEDWGPSFSLAVDAMTQIHDLTTSRQSVSTEWIHDWIDQPFAAIGQMKGHRDAATSQALTILEKHMLTFWSNRVLNLGVTHCNLTPGSFLVGTIEKSHPRALRMILGWSNSRQDGPAGFDICHLALTTRMAAREQEMGPVVHDLLNGGTWSDAERRWLARESPAADWLNQSDTMREMVILAWVHSLARHVHADPTHPANRIWRAVNLDWPLRQAKKYVSGK